MGNGARQVGMATDDRLEAGPDKTEVGAHPTQPGYTIACRNDAVVAAGNWADSSAGYQNALWFCSNAICQQAYIRRQKILRFREMQAAQGTPLPLDMGGPSLVAGLSNVTLDVLVPDSQVM